MILFSVKRIISALSFKFKISRSPLCSLLIFVLFSIKLSAQTNSSTHFTIDDGLVNNEITAIHQDRYGFLWFGTRGGLNRFNGYDFSTIRNNSSSKNNFTNQSIEVVANGNNNLLWIGTKAGGLNSYDLFKDSIKHYQAPKNINIQSIHALFEDKKGKLFIGSESGLFIYSLGRFYKTGLSTRVYALKQDEKGFIWIGTNNGLLYYHPERKKIYPVNLLNTRVEITAITVDNSKKTLYLGTWGKGFITYNCLTKEVKQYLHKKNDATSLSNNNAYSVLIDIRKNVWIGTWGGGLNEFNSKTKIIKHHSLQQKDYSRDDDIILSLQQDKTGLIWVGTDGGGVCKIDPFKKEFRNISVSSEKLKNVSDPHVLAVFKDSDNGLWVGTKGNGLNYSVNDTSFYQKKLNLITNSVRHFTLIDKALWVSTANGLIIYPDYKNNDEQIVYQSNRENPVTLSSPKITAIVKDKTGVIWVGTQEFGLNKVVGITNGKYIFKRYLGNTGEKYALQNRRISCMLVDKNNRLWIGTYNGLHLYDRQKDNFKLLGNANNLSLKLTNNTILSLAEDTRGNIWVGTQQGLNKVSTKNSSISIKKYFGQTGFPNDYVHAIQIDTKDNVWLATNKGITKFNDLKNEFINFDTQDGLIANAFSENASFQSENGEIFFGSVKGITSFYPDSIMLNMIKPKIYFTNLKINNIDIVVDKSASSKSTLHQAVFLTKKIQLSYRENIINLAFAALDYHAPAKNNYAYKLVGFDRDWVYSGKRRNATYTNLPAGNYTFKVIASNNDLIWNKEGIEIIIEILPPFWKTWWAYGFYIMVILGLLWLFRYLSLSRVNLKNNLQIANLNFQKEHEIAEIKNKIFTNISHEFRTPLTLMIGPLEGLTQHPNLNPGLKNTIYKIQNQARRVLSLVNQLLDFQKAEANLLTLNLSRQDVVNLTKTVFESFKDEAQRKGINYNFYNNLDTVFLMIDKDKIENIIYNLLSNAFKFTSAGENVNVFINYFGEEKVCEFIVSDTGEGIVFEDQAHIFDRFYQASHLEPGKFVGSGVGLAFVKELVQLHQGTIYLQSTFGLGSSFKVVLPIVHCEQVVDAVIDEDKIEETTIIGEHESSLPKHDLPLMLVVEDNVDLNQYLCEIFSAFTKVITAKDGKDGISKAIQNMPDIIVSDVSMPNADGYTLCSTLKNDHRTSHIPIILLTAKSDDLSHITGVKSGADNYISKPFNPEVLISHVNALIESRKKLKELFAHNLNLEPGKINITSNDEEFIKNIINYIEINISKEELSIDDLAKLTNMSRSTFYRKLKMLTGYAGSDFIRLIRLKRSAQLLNSGEFTVSQAAYSSGFNDLKHYRKSFQKQFNTSPSAYLNKK